MRRYLVTGFCRLTGLWRDYVLAPSASEAIRIYCATYGMDPAQCAASPCGAKIQLRRAA